MNNLSSELRKWINSCDKNDTIHHSNWQMLSIIRTVVCKWCFSETISPGDICAKDFLAYQGHCASFPCTSIIGCKSWALFVKNYFSERIDNRFPIRVGVECHVHEIERDFKVLYSVMVSHNGMIDGDGKRLDSSATDLRLTFRNFERDWEAWCLESQTIHSFVDHSSR
jgi:hypothetical protein